MNNEKETSHTKKQVPKISDYSEHSDTLFTRNICSSTDCTGLIPALPSSDEELEAYEEMYAFCAQVEAPAAETVRT